ncbi:MAG: glycosyltransferase family 2 protein [Pseudomonadota bacterium]
MAQFCENSAFPWARIVIVAYRSANHIQACLDSLAAQTMRNFEVIVVNNDCPEDSTVDLRLPDSRFEIINSEINLGFAGGANEGARDALTEWIITLNPDTLVHEDWLSELVAASLNSPEYDILGATLINANDRSIVDGFGDVLSIYGLCWRGGYGRSVRCLPDEDRQVFGACAASAAYRRAMFESLGGFDPDYFCYLEDMDLAFRSQISGYKCLQVRHAITYHFMGQSSKDEGEFATLQSYRNNLRLIIKNARPLMLLPMLFLYAAFQSYSIFRNRRSPLTSTRIAGLKQSLGTTSSAWHARKHTQTQANLSSITLVRRLAWRASSLRLRRFVSFG